jgi:fucose permease
MAATPATAAPRSGRAIVLGTLAGFVVLGLPDGMLGVAWPPLRGHFGQPLSALGELLLASLAGYLVVAGSTGRVLRRFGTAALLMAAAAGATAGAVLVAAAPGWPGLVVASFLLGSSSGGLDASLNTTISLAARPRWMNLLHAAYGVGAALGPLLVTAALAAGTAWRGAYAVLALLEVGLLALWVGLRRGLPRVAPAPGAGPASALPAAGPPHPPVRRLLRLLLSLALFFVYTGLEAAVGAWAASYLRGPEAFSAALAGVAVFLYWSGLTAGRFGTAALGPRLSAAAVARLGGGVSLAATVLLWEVHGAICSVIALVLLGAGLGPIFPALVTLTPARLGAEAALYAVGWELAAAGVGGAGLSALAGLVLQGAGLAAFGPVLAVLAATVLGLDLLLERSAPPALA